MVVTESGPVKVIEVPSTLTTAMPFPAMVAVFPAGVAVHTYVALDVNAGLNADTVTADGVPLTKATVPE